MVVVDRSVHVLRGLVSVIQVQSPEGHSSIPPHSLADVNGEDQRTGETALRVDEPEQPSVQPPFSGAPVGTGKGLGGKWCRRKPHQMFPCNRFVCVMLSVVASSSCRADSSSSASSCATSWRTLTGRAASSCRAG